MKVFNLTIILIQFAFLPLQAQFILNGSAVDLGGDCIRLTPNALTQTGSAWNPDKVNLRQDFRVEVDMFLGSSNAGADGMDFVLQPISTAIGVSGGGLGYLGVSPSLAAEFDTWQNTDYFDPACDHVAIVSNGNPSHSGPTSLVSPVDILATSCNAEDNTYHAVSIRWTAATTTLEVFVDCVPRVSYSGDVVSTIFGGDSLVFYGFTAATGGAANEHTFCFRKLDFSLPTTTFSTCPGDTVALESALGFSGYSWSPETNISDPSSSNPLVWPDVTTTYIVSYSDDCGEVYEDSVIIEVSPDIILPVLPSDPLICEGESLTLGDAPVPGYVYLWSTGSTASSITVDETGIYSLSIQSGVCQDSTSVSLQVQPYPNPQIPEDSYLVCPTETVLITVDVIADEISWNTGGSSTTIAVEEAGTYVVIATTNGCSASDSATVAFNLECDCQPSLPNAFSPNGDGLNDEFRFLNIGACPALSQYSLHIYNRWGELIYETFDAFSGWDGTWRGKPSEIGTYLYTAVVPQALGGVERRTGTVTLVR